MNNKSIKPIEIRGHAISPIVISTIMGHSGDGVFPLTLLPGYRKLRQIIPRNRVTIFTKSSTFDKHDGNFFVWRPWTWRYVRRIGYKGMLNAYGLTNQGVKANAPEIALAIRAGYNVIPNFYPQFAKGREAATAETVEAIKIYDQALGLFFWALELNFSCPNDKVKIRENMENAVACVKAVRREYPNLVLIAKISIVHPHEFAQELVKAGVDIIHAINTIPYDLVYPDGPRSPLVAVGGGGISGAPVFYQAFRHNEILRKRVSVPMIMGCGVVNSTCAQACFDAGANAVSLCTVCRLDPKEAIKIIEEFA